MSSAEDVVSALAGEPQKYRIIRDPVTQYYHVQYRKWSWLRWGMTWKTHNDDYYGRTFGSLRKAREAYQDMIAWVEKAERKKQKLPLEVIEGK
jgi:hypothetical protein